MRNKRRSNRRRKKEIKSIVKEGDRFDNRNRMIENRRQNTIKTRAFRTPQSFGPASDCIIIKSKDEE